MTTTKHEASAWMLENNHLSCMYTPWYLKTRCNRKLSQTTQCRCPNQSKALAASNEEMNHSRTMSTLESGSIPVATIIVVEDESNDERSEIEESLREFIERRHSMKISASRIAAMTGFNPFAAMPELLLDLVYQGRCGHELQMSDAASLGLELCSEERIVQNLIEKVTAQDKGAKETLEQALFLSSSSPEAIPKSNEEATAIKQQAMKVIIDKQQQKQQRLSADEIQYLQNAIRQSVNTTYGTLHENEALDRYEVMTGSQVRHRNAFLYAWNFRDVETSQITSTVLPMGPPNKTCKHAMSSSYSAEEMPDDHSKQINQDVEAPACLPVSQESTNCKGRRIDNDSKPKLHDHVSVNQQTPKIFLESSPLNDETPKTKDEKQTTNQKPTKTTFTPDHPDQKQLPFFTLYGSVDGIRDEPYFRPKEDNVDNHEYDSGFDWCLRPVVVECKHRLRTIPAKLSSSINNLSSPPPLYDQIQVVAYCLMCETDDADIVQVIRTKGQSQTKRIGDSIVAKNKKLPKISMNSETDNSSSISNSESQEQRFQMNHEAENSIFLQNEDNVVVKSHDEEPSQKQESSSKFQSQELLSLCDDTAESNPSESVDNGSELGPDVFSMSQVCAMKNIEQNPTFDENNNKRNEKKRMCKGDNVHEDYKDDTSMFISISRVSLDDPCMSHRRNWFDVILPRLRSFVNAAYSIRSNEKERRRLLLACSSLVRTSSSVEEKAVLSDDHGDSKSSVRWQEEQQEEAWTMVFERCPWAMDCDTAYHRLLNTRTI